MLLLLTPLALAAVPAEERFLANDRLAYGVASDGSFINTTLGLGLLWDPDGPAGEMPVGGDQLTAGNQFAVWSMTYDGGGDLVMQEAYGSSALTLDWEELGWTETVSWARGRATTGDFELTVTHVLPESSDAYLWVLDLTALTDLDNLQIAHVFDPDPDFPVNGSYDTVNVSGAAFAAGMSQVEPRAMAVAIVEGQGGICSWCNTAAGVEAGANASYTGDYQVGVTSPVISLAAGASMRVQVGYGLGVDLETAAAAARDAAAWTDWDGDGVDGDTDCDDLDAATFPGASELADGRDNDCDGAVDNDSTAIDDDGDGYAEADGDCDDADPFVHPGAVPTGEGDADCDGVADDWDPDVPADVKQGGETPEGCGCQTVSPHLTPFVVLLGLALRRRA